MKYFYLSIFLTFVFIPFFSFGYIEKTDGGTLTEKVTPKNPEPEQDVLIVLSGFGYNLNRSNITWEVNGFIDNQASNKTSHTIKMGRLGSITDIKITVLTDNGKTITKNLTFYPASVDFIYEADSYTPPFYMGASLPTSESLIKIKALPSFINENNQKIPEGNIEFSWFQNNNKLTGKSGLGQSELEIPMEKFGDQIELSLLAESVDGKYKAEKTLTISREQPEIVLYEVKPLVGVNYHKQIDNQFNLESDQVVIQAEPYYFAKQKIANDIIDFVWSLNNNQIENDGVNKKVIALQKPENVSGQSTLSVLVRNTINTTERIVKNININFGRSTINF